eukprot:g351.t1
MPGWFSKSPKHADDDKSVVTCTSSPLPAVSPGTSRVLGYRTSTRATRIEASSSVVTHALLDSETRLSSNRLAIDAPYSFTFSRPVVVRRLTFQILHDSKLRGFDLQYKDAFERYWNRCHRVVVRPLSSSSPTVLRTCVVDVPATDGSRDWRITHLKCPGETVVRLWNVRVLISSLSGEEKTASGEATSSGLVSSAAFFKGSIAHDAVGPIDKRAPDNDDDDDDDDDSRADASKVILSGWLMKRNNGFLRTWSRRFVTLTAGGLVEYRKTPNEIEARRSIKLNVSTVIEACVRDDQVFAISIREEHIGGNDDDDTASSARVDLLCLAATSAVDRDLWMAALQKVADDVASDAPSASALSMLDDSSDTISATTASSNVVNDAIAWTIYTADLEWSYLDSRLCISDEMLSLRPFYCVLDKSLQKLSFYKSRSERHALATRTLRGVTLTLEPEPRLILLSTNRGRRFYTVRIERTLGGAAKQWFRLFFLSTQQRNATCQAIRDAADAGVHGTVWVRFAAGNYDHESEWKRRYFELRNESEAISFFREPDDRASVLRVPLRNYVLRPIRLEQRTDAPPKDQTDSGTTVRKWRRSPNRRPLNALQLWHPSQPLYTLCLDDDGLYRRLRSALLSVLD